jgi:hypothetical protein
MTPRPTPTPIPADVAGDIPELAAEVVAAGADVLVVVVAAPSLAAVFVEEDADESAEFDDATDVEVEVVDVDDDRTRTTY